LEEIAGTELVGFDQIMKQQMKFLKITSPFTEAGDLINACDAIDIVVLPLFELCEKLTQRQTRIC
jgi:hypothetical protein